MDQSKKALRAFVLYRFEEIEQARFFFTQQNILL
jgi:hypothetical protein